MTIIMMIMIIKECQEYRVLGTSEDVTTAGCASNRPYPNLHTPCRPYPTLPTPCRPRNTPPKRISEKKEKKKERKKEKTKE